ncbi:hypothetical protein ACFVS2_20435 [Brevibacillus sp. NPDC058079]|uniref:hypothetical protein n=1 Tax=Brevibacillus sp. NPDC058079 TaxID=3346330 RepID=UPI0036ECD452
MAIMAHELISILKSGKKPVVQFEPAVEEFETIFDHNMRGRAIGFIEQTDGLIRFMFEVKEFEAYNIPHMKPWNEDDTKKVIDTAYYPKDGIEQMYYEPQEELPLVILEDNDLLSAYAESGSNDSYVLWLEKSLNQYVEAFAELEESLEKDVPILEELKERRLEDEAIRLGGKIEGVKHAIERIRTTKLHHSIKK